VGAKSTRTLDLTSGVRLSRRRCALLMEWRALELKGSGPGPRSSHTLVATDEALYVFGGELEPRVPVDNVLYKYSLASSSWEQVQASGTAPSARNAPTAALVGKTICESLRTHSHVLQRCSCAYLPHCNHLPMQRQTC
jgi:Galactose oxidase, central domain